MDMAAFELGLYRLFFEAGLAIGISFVLGMAVGLTAMTYLQRQKKEKRK